MENIQTSLGAVIAHGPVLDLDDSILELLPAAVFVCNADGVVVRYNRRASEIWGRTPQRGDTRELFCGSYRIYDQNGQLLPHHECPMAQVLRSGIAARDREIIMEQPGGRRYWVNVSAEPIRNADDELIGAINCFHDITARKAAEERLRESEELLRAVFETTPECIKIVGRDGTLLRMNRAGLDAIEAERSEQAVGADTFALIAPEHRADWQAYHERVCAGEELNWEFDVIGLGGTRRHMETRAVPLRMPDGSVAQLAVTRDITFRKNQERQQQLLLNELNHRVKNTLATVQSIAAQTFRGKPRTDAQLHFQARLLALAKAHDVLTGESWQGAGLRQIVVGELKTHASEPSRFSVEGPDVHLTPKTALSMAMAIHELCTNAVKYGAFSNTEGTVSVAWQLTPQHDEGRKLHLVWQEQGGPPVTPPLERGFGSRLIEQGLATELRGEVEISYPPEGVICTIDAPLPVEPGH